MVSWVSTTLGQAVEGAKSKGGFIVALLVLFVVFGCLSRAVLRGSAVARHRIRRSLDAPLNALWETIGAAGKPLKDAARQFALLAIILTGIGFLVIPIALVFAFFRQPVVSRLVHSEAGQRGRSARSLISDMIFARSKSFGV